jgi:hypothetical protein
MTDQRTHVLIVDYCEERRKELRGLLLRERVVCHEAGNRMEAIGRLWELASLGVIPRAVITNWLLDEPKAREFFSLIGREIDHTSLNFIKNVMKIDLANEAANKTITICYAETDELADEAVSELAGEGLTDQVAVTTYDPLEGFYPVVGLLMSDERTKIIRLVQTERLYKNGQCSSSSDHPRRLSR